MYTPTQNYGLAMPSYGDEADIGVINDMVTAKVDELLFQNRTISAPPFETTEAYAEGDLVVYENVLYRFTADKTAGAWDSSKVVQTSLAAEIEDRGSGGDSLSDLTDTDIDTPVEGEVLTWNGSEWVNAEGTPSVTKTATGNPIEFSDGADAPLVKCTTAIQGNQDLHGQDKPWVGGAGKNKLALVLSDIKAINTSGTWTGNVYVLNGVTFTILTDGAENITGIKATGTASANAPLIVCNNPDLTEGASYIMNGSPANGSDSSYKIQYSNNVDVAYNDRGSGVEFTEFSHAYPYLNRTIRAVIYSGYAIPSGGLIFYPMIRLSTETDSTFEPYSNICHITAYTEGKIVERGKNLAPSSPIEIGQYVNGDFVYYNARITSDYMPIQPNKPYTASIDRDNINNLAFINYAYFDKDKTFLGDRSVNGEESFNGQKTHTCIIHDSRAAFLRYTIRAYSDPAIDISGKTLTNSQFMVEAGSTATTYEPYTSTTHTTTYPSAIYRGSEDVVNGTVGANGDGKEWIVADLGDLTWYDSTDASGQYFYATITGIKRSASGESLPFAICENYAPTKSNSVSDGQFAISSNHERIFVRDTRYSTTSDFTTAVTGVKLAYELATPTTSSVTPTNLPIKSLFGYNHIESSTGEMEIEYITQGYQPIVDLIQSSQHVYSTQERIVGKWVDGSSDVYERSINLGSFSVGSGGNHTVEQSTDMNLLIDYDGYVIESDIVYALPDPSIRIKLTSDKSLIFTGEASWDVTSGYLTIRYTKSTATTRSLSKGTTDSLKAEISEVKGEDEELTTTDEMTVKKAQSEDTETKEEAETEGNADEVQDKTDAE